MVLKLTLTLISGVFMMVGVGIGVGFIILFIEIGYSRYERAKERQITLAKKAVARWKRYVQVSNCKSNNNRWTDS